MNTRASRSLTALLVPLAATALAACSPSAEGEPVVDKEAFRARSADSPLSYDPCARHRWYGDAECDSFCPVEDPDCAPSACERDEDCGETERCAPGLCYLWCEVGDLACCVGNTCEPEEPTTTECRADDECGDGERCVPGPICLDWCLRGDPSCCSGNACAPLDPPGSRECLADADCAEGERCEAGPVCLDWCLRDDPSCCSGNVCAPRP
jgi:Cys-rich repeat protein